MQWTECHILKNVVCWNQVPNVMVFGGEAFGRWWGQEGGALINGISALEKENPHPHRHVKPEQEDSYL